MMKNLIMKMMLKKVFALFSQTKLIWLALLMVGTTAHAGVTVRYQHTDSLGSVIMETNASGQMIGSRHQYQPFGQGLNGQKSGLGYTGHLEDTDLGLTYMQQRYYDPVIGRFYSNDPVGFTASNPMIFNRYAYANNNPYRYVDPDGRFIVPIHGAITFFASLSAGNGFSDSARHAYRSMQADWESGSQDVNSLSAARHAMRIEEVSPNDAAILNQQLISNAVTGGDLGLAAHAIQDQFSASHEGFQIWGGVSHAGIWGTLKHVLNDTFVSPSRVSGAFTATKNMFKISNGSGSGSSKQRNSSGSKNSQLGVIIPQPPQGICSTALMANCGSASSNKGTKTNEK